MRRPLAIVLCYSLFSLIVLAPLTLHLDSRVPGGPVTDYYHFNWNFWWMRHALTTGQNPYFTGYTLAPLRHNLAVHTLTPIWLPFYVIFEPPLGQLPTTNLMIWLSLTLTGIATYALLRQHTIQPPSILIIDPYRLLESTPCAPIRSH